MTQQVMRGRLIVFEGPDGVGKSTVSKSILNYLRERGEECELLTFPGKEPGTLGGLVYSLHHDSLQYGIESLTPASRQALHIAAHLDTIERQILPALSNGRYVLLDRFWWSTWVYGLVGGIEKVLLKNLITVELTQWRDIKPTAVILLRRSSPLDRDDDLTHWQMLSDEYSSLATKEKSRYPVFVLDNDGPFLDTVDRVRKIIERRFHSRGRTRSEMPYDHNEQMGITFSATNSARVSAPHILTHLLPARPSVVFDTWWRFAAERQKIFFKRLAKDPFPWTDDPILYVHKFTNVYRASDRVSQYLIRHVIYREDLPSTPDEVFFRIIFFKLFNKIETWRLFEKSLGPITYADYVFKHYDRILTQAMNEDQTIYSAAYIMPSGGSLGHSQKHRNHLRLIELMMKDGLPKKLQNAPSMQRGFELLREYPTIGDFLAYQFITDVNYSGITNFSEMDFVVPGPGALDGIRKCFIDYGGLNEPEIIRMMADRQEEEFARLGIEFQDLWGRRLQLIDCQNLFCEVDKYSRVAHPDILGISGRTRIKQKYSPSSEPLECWYPPKWGINGAVEEWLSLQTFKQRRVINQEVGDGF
jgi:thymidylate kinase